MEYVKIRLPERDQISELFLDLVRTGRLFVLKEGQDNILVLPAEGLDILKKAKVEYEELDRWD